MGSLGGMHIFRVPSLFMYSATRYVGLTEIKQCAKSKYPCPLTDFFIRNAEYNQKPPIGGLLCLEKPTFCYLFACHEIHPPSEKPLQEK